MIEAVTEAKANICNQTFEIIYLLIKLTGKNANAAISGFIKSLISKVGGKKFKKEKE